MSITKYYKIYPEVPAGIGENSVINRIPGQPLEVIKMHLVFEGWLGSDLMKTSPVFYVTEKLKDALEKEDFSGISVFEKIEVTKSENFIELYPELELPNFFLMRIIGVAYKSDFGIDIGKLVVSELALNFLKQFQFTQVEIEEISN